MRSELIFAPRAILPFLLCGAHLILFLVALASCGPSKRAKWLLALYLLMALLAQGSRLGPALSGLGATQQLLLSGVSLWASSALPAAFYLLTLGFLDWQSWHPAWWALGVVWALAALVLSLPARLLGRWTTALDWTELLRYLPALGWAIFLVLSFYLSTRTLRRTPHPQRRNRLGYWFLIEAALALGYGISFWREGLLAGTGALIALLANWLTVYAVLGRELVDLKRLRRGVLSYLIVTLITISIYLFVNTLAQEAFSRLIPSYSRLIGIVVAALVVAALYQPLYNLVQRTVDRVLIGVGYEYLLALRDYSQNVNCITDLDELAVKAVALLSRAMGIERGALLTIEAEADRPDLTLRVIPGMGVIEAEPLQTTWLHPLLRYLSETGAPITQRDINRLAEFQAMSAREREWLHRLAMAVYVPIRASEGLLGILALGAKGSGEPYYPSDLDLLATIGEQTVLALRNAQRFADLAALNEGIARLNEELRRLDQTKNNLITIASHELKTPLTLIQGYAGILESFSTEELQNKEQVAHIVEGIVKGAERLRHIVDDMLDISRIDANALALQWSECQLSQILGMVVEHLGPAAEERKQSLEMPDLAALPTFRGDPQRLYQVFHNLVENAIKFTPDRGRISISARLLDEETSGERFIEAIVADTGIGIAPEDQERIFDKFHRVENVSFHSSSNVHFKGGGPGLGLAIAKGIVEAHGGKIWVVSPGRDEQRCPGSEFHVLLPIRKASPQERLQGAHQ